MRGKRTEILAFIGGLVFFTVLAGIVVSRDNRIREELENQAQKLLRISRDAMDQAQLAVATIKDMTQGLKIDKRNSKYTEPQHSIGEPDGEGTAGSGTAGNATSETPVSESDGYAALWQVVEARNGRRLSRRTSQEP
jgi:hypothetical protein